MNESLENFNYHKWKEDMSKLQDTYDKMSPNIRWIMDINSKPRYDRFIKRTHKNKKTLKEIRNLK